MVAPASSSRPSPSLDRRKGTVPADPPTNYYLLLFVKICLVVIILLWLAPLVTGRSDHPTNRGNGRRRRKELRLRTLRLECQNEGKCALLVPEESLNCVNQCLSNDCYERIFAHDPLEDGEVDLVRGQQFEDCVKEELKILRKSTTW